MFSALPNGVLGSPTGMPVHFIDGKWYLEVKPSGWTKSEIHDVLNIMEVLEPGTTKVDKMSLRISVWDGEQWAGPFPELAFDELHIPHEMTVSPSALRALKEWSVEIDEENERLALRRALAEAQAEEE